MLLSPPVLAPTLQEEFDLTLTEVGIALASVWIGPIFTLLLWGLAADRFGERWSLTAGLAGMGLLVAGVAFVDDFVGLVFLLALASAAGSSVNSASGRAVMHWFTAEERGFALGLRQASLPLGGALAAVTLPLIVVATSLQGAFLFLAALCFAAAVAGALVIRDRPGEGDAVVEAVPWTLRDRRLWILSGGSGLYLMAQIAMAGFLVLFLHDARGLSNGEAAAVLAVAQVFAIGLRIAAGRWSDRARSRVRPLRLVGLAIFTGVLLVTTLVDAPLACSFRRSSWAPRCRWPGTGSPTPRPPSWRAARAAAPPSGSSRRLSPSWASLRRRSSPRSWMPLRGARASPSGRRHRSPAGGC